MHEGKPRDQDSRLGPLGPAPPASSEAIRRSMVGNRPTNTNPETRVRQALWAAGIKGYRKDWQKAPGKPDIAFVGRRVAVFVHGCYWHSCPKCNIPRPKKNAD